jgi:hypothetical protein
MAVACPSCKSAALVHDLPAVWKSLPHETALRAELAPPPAAVLQWVPAAACLAVTVILLASSVIVFGLLALLVTGILGWTAYRSFAAAQAAADAWNAALYCRHCHNRFAPTAGFIEAA